MRKKLVEVALPLEAINKASAHEKSIQHVTCGTRSHASQNSRLRVLMSIWMNY